MFTNTFSMRLATARWTLLKLRELTNKCVQACFKMWDSCGKHQSDVGCISQTWHQSTVWNVTPHVNFAHCLSLSWCGSLSIIPGCSTQWNTISKGVGKGKEGRLGALKPAVCENHLITLQCYLVWKIKYLHTAAIVWHKYICLHIIH